MRKVFSNILGCLILVFLLLSILKPVDVSAENNPEDMVDTTTAQNRLDAITGAQTSEQQSAAIQQTPDATTIPTNDAAGAAQADANTSTIPDATTDTAGDAQADATTNTGDGSHTAGPIEEAPAVAGAPADPTGQSILNSKLTVTPPKDETAWSWFTLIGGPIGLVARLYAWLLNMLIMPLLSGILDFTTRAMNSVLQFSLDTKNYDSSSATGSAIQMGWVLIRDILNIAFIFLLIKSAIEAITGKGINQKLIRDIIIAALFVNFSLYLTKLVIDVYNIFAVSIYNSIVQVIQNGAGGDNVGQNIWLVMWSGSNLNPFAGDMSNLAAMQNSGLSAYIKVYTMIGFMCVAIWVFFKMTLMFLSRAIAFMILMITSPIYFIGPLVPQLQGYAKKWFPELNAAGLMAPLFLILLFIVVKMINDPAFIAMIQRMGTESKVDIAGTLYFVLILGFLHKSMEIVKENSGQLGSWIDSKAKQGIGLAVGTTAAIVTGGAALATRGAAASTLRNKQLLGEAAREGVGGDAARAKLAAAQRRYENPLFGMEKYGKYGNQALGMVGIKPDNGGLGFMSPDLTAKYDMKNPPKRGLESLKEAISPNGATADAQKDLKKKQREIGKVLIGARKDKEKEENEIAAEEMTKKHNLSAEQRDALKTADEGVKASKEEAKKKEDLWKDEYEKHADVKALNKVNKDLEAIDKQINTASMKLVALQAAGATAAQITAAKLVLTDPATGLNKKQADAAAEKTAALARINADANLVGKVNRTTGEYELNRTKKDELDDIKKKFAEDNYGKTFADLEAERAAAESAIQGAAANIQRETKNITSQANDLAAAASRTATPALANTLLTALSSNRVSAMKPEEVESLKAIAEKMSKNIDFAQNQAELIQLADEINSRKRRLANAVRNEMKS